MQPRLHLPMCEIVWSWHQYEYHLEDLQQNILLGNLYASHQLDGRDFQRLPGRLPQWLFVWDAWVTTMDPRIRWVQSVAKLPRQTRSTWAVLKSCSAIYAIKGKFHLGGRKLTGLAEQVQCHENQNIAMLYTPNLWDQYHRSVERRVWGGDGLTISVKRTGSVELWQSFWCKWVDFRRVGIWVSNGAKGLEFG